jgi:hypothetical protein
MPNNDVYASNFDVDERDGHYRSERKYQDSSDRFGSRQVAGGTTWVDIANFAHTTSSLSRAYNLSAQTAVTTVYTVTDGTLADDTCKDGLIGDQLRVKFTSTGTYAGTTTMKVYAVAKS